MNIKDANNDGIAMDGFDPVAYFNGQPLRGQEHFQFTLRDLTYRFANKENLEKFQEDPAKYEPIVGSYTTESFRGNLNELSKEGKFIGNKTLDSRQGLADAKVSLENNVPIDTMQDGDVEMQNQSDEYSRQIEQETGDHA